MYRIIIARQYITKVKTSLHVLSSVFLQKAVDMTHGAEIRTLPFSLDGSSAIINQR